MARIGLSGGSLLHEFQQAAGIGLEEPEGRQYRLRHLAMSESNRPLEETEQRGRWPQGGAAVSGSLAWPIHADQHA
jgi:hypothetical protein